MEPTSPKDAFLYSIKVSNGPHFLFFSLLNYQLKKRKKLIGNRNFPYLIFSF